MLPSPCMKFCVNIVLFLFLAFLAAPTIVSLLQDDADTSMVYNLSEEEYHKDIKEVKAGPQMDFGLTLFMVPKKTALINSDNLQRPYSVFGDIFSPPPERA